MTTECTFASKHALVESQCDYLLTEPSDRIGFYRESEESEQTLEFAFVKTQPIAGEPVSLDRLYQEDGALMFMPAGDGYCAYPIAVHDGDRPGINADTMLRHYDSDVRRGFGLAADLYANDRFLRDEFAMILGDDKTAYAHRYLSSMTAQFIFIGGMHNVEHYIRGARELYHRMCGWAKEVRLSADKVKESSEAPVRDPVTKETAEIEIDAFMEGWLKPMAPGLYDEVIGVTQYQTWEECTGSWCRSTLAFYRQKTSQIVLLPSLVGYLGRGSYDFAGVAISHENAHRNAHHNLHMFDPISQIFFAAYDIFMLNHREEMSEDDEVKFLDYARREYGTKDWFNEIQANIAAHVVTMDIPVTYEFHGWLNFCHYIINVSAAEHYLTAGVVALGLDYVDVATQELRTSSWNSYLVDLYLQDMMGHLDCMNGGRCDQPSDALIELAATYPDLEYCFEYFEGARNRFID